MTAAKTANHQAVDSNMRQQMLLAAAFNQLQLGFSWARTDARRPETPHDLALPCEKHVVWQCSQMSS